MNSLRLTSISMIRIFSIVMIIICHILQGLGYEAAFWFNLGVQIFLFMSGFLYGIKVNKEEIIYWLKKQFLKIIVPFIILFFLVLIIDKVVFNIEYGKLFIVGNMLGLASFVGCLKTMSHTWFISYILICYLITPMLNTIDFNDKASKQIIKELVLIAIFLQILQYFGVIRIIAPYIFNYILGFYFARLYIFKKEYYHKLTRQFVYISLIVLLPRLLIQYNFFAWNYPAIIINNVELIEQWSHVLLGSSIFLLLFSKLTIFNGKNYKCLKYTDKYSYCIYLVHQIFILNYLSILWITDNIALNIFLIFLASILCGVVLSKCSDFVLKCFKKIRMIYTNE